MDTSKNLIYFVTRIFIIAFLFLVFKTSIASGQSKDSSQHNTDIFQIRLQDPAKCIQHIEYDDTHEEIKGYLNEDGTIIYLDSYTVGKKVKLKVVFASGREEEILRSPCSVELSEKKTLL